MLLLLMLQYLQPRLLLLSHRLRMLLLMLRYQLLLRLLLRHRQPLLHVFGLKALLGALMLPVLLL